MTIELTKAQAAEIVRVLGGQVLKGAGIELVRELDRLLDEGEL